MRALLIGVVLMSTAAYAGEAEDLAACKAQHVELTAKAASFQGDTRMKRLIDADLRRAAKEASDGDADECKEALDHAAKLLAGEA